MQSKQKIKNIINNFKLISLKTKVLIIFVAAIITLMSLALIISKEKVIVFSYGDQTCVKQLTLFPDIAKVADGSQFSIDNRNIFSINGFKIASFETCFMAKSAPSLGESKVSVSLFNGFGIKKVYKLSVPNPPTLNHELLDYPIPSSKPLLVQLSNKDMIFDYRLKVQDEESECLVDGTDISCSLESYKLIQGQQYPVEINRFFNDKNIDTLISKNIKILEPVNVVASSVLQDQIIYDNTKKFEITFNKSVIGGNAILERINNDSRTVHEVNLVFDENKLNIDVLLDLNRDSDYELTLLNIDGVDGSMLSGVCKIKFKMSDGPSVSSINVGNYGLELSKTIIIKFDQSLNINQSISDYVSVAGINANISKSGSQINISYTNAPMCTSFDISIKAGLMNNFNIDQKDAWSFSSRTMCRSVSSIGNSVEGRPIITNTFGSGDDVILFIGSIHGNEYSSKYLMDEWVNELERNNQNIPTNKKVIVIPNLNPDGFAANRRNNANNVDLNRNFETADWQTDTYAPDNSLIVGGGGLNPLSEPESQAIAAFTLQLNPKLVLSFHGAASYVIANQAGGSNAWADIYGQLTGYSNMTGVPGGFSYPITGTYDDWLLEKHGIPSVIVELANNFNAEFSRNKAALWEMVKI